MKYSDLLRNEKVKQAQFKILVNLPFWIAAGIAALVAVGYNVLFKFAEDFAFSLINSGFIYISAPIGILLSFLIGHFIAESALGSGIPQVMASIEISDNSKQPFLLKQLLSFRMLVVKIIGSSIAIAGGAVAGREGPTLQISAALFFQIYRFWPRFLPRPNLLSMILAGGAAGLAAAFNTPLGGVVFAIEELAKTKLSEVRTAVFQAVIIAGIMAQLFLGNYLYLGNRSFNNIPLSAVYETIAISLIVGVVASFFAESLYRAGKLRAGLNFSKKLLMTLACGLLVSLVIYLSNGLSVGSGKEVILHLLENPTQSSDSTFPIARILGLFFTYIGGVIGGIFAPSLSAGASLGHYLSTLLAFENTRLLILVGMVAFLTGVTRSPFTSFVLVLEMSSSNEVILYLMLSATISNLAAKTLFAKGFYEQVTEDILKQHNYTRVEKAAGSS